MIFRRFMINITLVWLICHRHPAVKCQEFDKLLVLSVYLFHLEEGELFALIIFFEHVID